MSKHTPGPWHITVGAAYRQIEAVDGTLICFAASNNWANKANARLIAAAPDLLQALKAALTVLPDSVGDFDYNAAVDAVAKATGGEAS